MLGGHSSLRVLLLLLGVLLEDMGLHGRDPYQRRYKCAIPSCSDACWFFAVVVVGLVSYAML